MKAVYYFILSAVETGMFFVFYLTAEGPEGYVASGMFLTMAIVVFCLGVYEAHGAMKELRAARRAEKLRKKRQETYEAARDIMLAASGKICDICPLKEKCTKGQMGICHLGSALREATEEEIEKIYADEEGEE